MSKRIFDLGVKVNMEEEQIIVRKAKELSMTKSEYVRFCALNSKFSVEVKK